MFQLSGGLDSTALVLTNHLLGNFNHDEIATYIWDEFKEVDERTGAQLIGTKVGKDITLIPADELLPFSFDNIKDNLPDEPTPDLCLISWRLPMFEFAHRLNSSVIISGYGGDDLLFGNQCILFDMLKKYKLLKCWKEALEFAKRNNELGLTASWFIKSYALLPLLKIKQKPPVLSLWDPSIHNRFFEPFFLNFLQDWRLGKESISTSKLYTLISACAWVDKCNASF